MNSKSKNSGKNAKLTSKDKKVTPKKASSQPEIDPEDWEANLEAELRDKGKKGKNKKDLDDFDALDFKDESLDLDDLLEEEDNFFDDDLLDDF